MTFDIVLYPVRGSWNLDDGWVETLRRRGCLGRVLRANPENVDAVFGQLEATESDAILLMGADYHLDFLHDTSEKREFWQGLHVPTLCYCFESILTDPFPHSLERADSACEAFSHFAYCDEADEAFFRERSLPALWLPQCVDELKFSGGGDHPRTDRVFFCGKTSLDLKYHRRVALLEGLGDFLAPFGAEVGVDELAEGYRSHRFAVNPPGNVRSYNVRAFEALSAGCLLFQAREADRPKNESLFADGHELVLFDPDSPADLRAKVVQYSKNPQEASRIAGNGRARCLAEHTVGKRLDSIGSFLQAAHAESRLIQVGCRDRVLKGFRTIDRHSNSPFAVADDARALDSVAEGSADLIYCRDAAEHIPRADAVDVLKRWRSKLADGGSVLISVPAPRYLAWKSRLRDAGFSKVERTAAGRHWFTAFSRSRWSWGLNVAAAK